MGTDKNAPLLVHHMANRDHGYPPNSLAGLRYCLEAGARVVEVDINPLRNGDFALLHDDMLEHETDGAGPVANATVDDVRSLHLRHNDGISAERVGVLSEALDFIQGYESEAFEELQLDLKVNPSAMSEALQRLVRLVQPARSLVRVTSGMDWALRRLQRLAPGVALGFDPLLYMGVSDTGKEIPPFRLGAYGYWDDHPLGARRWGATFEYLAARADVLWAQAPDCAVWYIDAWLLGRALDDGFDWIDYLHERSIEVDAWTLDAHRPEHLNLARRLSAAGVDRLTTNMAPELAAALSNPRRL